MAQAQYPPYQTRPIPVGQLDVERRATFLGRVYGHLFAAILLFVAVETALFMSGTAERLIDTVFSAGGMGTILILVAVIAGGWISTKAAFSPDPSAQYAGLVGEVAIYSFLFVPLLWFMFETQQAGDVGVAAVITLVAFGGLTAIGLLSRKDFSFLRGIVMFGFVLAIAAIMGGALFGFNLGLWFSVAMVGLSGAGILYQTQNILKNFPEEMFVGAAVSLFGYVMNMFYYVLRIFSSR